MPRLMSAAFAALAVLLAPATQAAETAVLECGGLCDSSSGMKDCAVYEQPDAP